MYNHCTGIQGFAIQGLKANLYKKAMRTVYCIVQVDLSTVLIFSTAIGASF